MRKQGTGGFTAATIDNDDFRLLGDNPPTPCKIARYYVATATTAALHREPLSHTTLDAPGPKRWEGGKV